MTALSLALAVAVTAGGAPELAGGALSMLASKRCEFLDPKGPSIEWPGAQWGKKLLWGPKRLGPCKGLGTDILAESLAGGALWVEVGAEAVAAEAALPKNPEQATRMGRTLGLVLRRTADGTWPTITKHLKSVIADYDPVLSKELGKKL